MQDRDKPQMPAWLLPLNEALLPEARPVHHRARVGPPPGARAVSIPADELFRMARENDFGPNEFGAAELLAAAIVRADERRECAIDIDTCRRVLWLLRGQQDG